MSFQKKLDSAMKKNKSLLCIGLDATKPSFDFNKKIIDATFNFACAYKPNSAFYEAYGSKGIEELKKTCDYLKTKYADIPVILDAKRADIGSTNEGYAKYAFDYLDVDAITLSPYLGKIALQPFLQRKEKGMFILCKTSNQGSEEFQDLLVDKKPLYLVVAKRVATDWNENGNCMLVVGATYPKELQKVREVAGDMTILVPGVGVQGGDLEKVMHYGLNSKGAGAIIHAGRTIFNAKNPGEEAKKIYQQINTYRKD